MNFRKIVFVILFFFIFHFTLNFILYKKSFEFTNSNKKMNTFFYTYQTIINDFANERNNRTFGEIKGRNFNFIEPNTISVILTGYKRPASQLRKQLEALKMSSMKPKKIFFYQNGNFVNFSQVLNDHPDVIHIFNPNYNFKFHGRFSIALFVNTEFVAVVDDEPICGKKWIEYAVENVEKLNALVGSSGRRILKNIYTSTQYQYSVDSKPGKGFNEVDFVGHWWVWKTIWTNAIWALPSVNLWTGEDIEFSAKLKILLGIKSVTLNYPSNEYIPEKKNSNNLNYVNGKNVASYLVPKTKEERISIILFWISKGWKPLFINDKN